jgi:arabinose-5-phosphate isomerase
MLKALFDDQRRYLNHFFEKIDIEAAEQVLEKLSACKGVIIFSGVGKSGHIAEKVTNTLISTGTRAFFLSAANALHGDLGFVTQADLFICFSKSGATQELLHLIPHIRKRGAHTIAIVSMKNSPLEKVADQTICLPFEREICPYDLAPTTSTVSQLIFGDSLAIALMQKKKFSISDFALNHPGGLLGRKISLTVADLMLKGASLPLVHPEDLLMHVLHELSAKKTGCLLVVNEAMELLGIFTDGDLRRSIESKGPDALRLPLSELMTHHPKTISPSHLAVDAMRQMEIDPSRLVTVLPVVEKGQLVGLVRMHDILQKELS